ncbi:MAG: DUF169 domain-containing protein [Candidatus Thorarchaeota archaeon]|jgi:uncharacterized protein (DUF169 family)
MKIGKDFEEILRLQTYPLAIKLVEDESEFPEKARRPEEKIAICQALTISRRYGWTMAMTEDDNACAAASIAYGWNPLSTESEMMKFYTEGGYAADEAGAKTIRENIDCLGKGKYRGLVISPLTRTKIEPDVVLVHGNSAQILRMIQGAMYKEGKRVISSLTGIAGSCAAGIIRAFKTNEYQVVVPANGERVFALVANDEMLFAMPAEKAEELANAMKKQRYAKYPIPTRMQTPPKFPEP